MVVVFWTWYSIKHRGDTFLLYGIHNKDVTIRSLGVDGKLGIK